MFRTELNPKTSSHKIQLSNPLISIGSCFADNIGKKLSQHKFKVEKNPFGVIFNPLSIFELVETAFNEERLSEDSYLVRDGIHFNYKVHSELHGKSQEKLELQINHKRNLLSKALRKPTTIIITLGTAWVYEEKKTQMLVANCHKIPSKQFNKRLLSSEEVSSAFMLLKEQLHAENPDLKFILTVSPIRHVKDTLELNMVSKSILRLACHQISTYADDVDYFPAYELLMDDLRDYRFYEKDMLHPNQLAQEYIWGKFMDVYFDKETKAFIKNWSEIRSAMKHKAFHPESDAHQKFLQKTIEKLEQLKGLVKVDKELAKLRKQLIG
ncbi:GSCFA domain-containing protein [uncultured Roseivirga sp.]|uniref:GSCFA domain-containing protein n=1 Tax=uncultured Roseivirga sp. TaxID=543088 RepID=UPI0030D992DF|tara:strand:+ start:119773 stop:120747 length:975 start_codon:yes stop_codon:yes gene_type:complete